MHLLRSTNNDSMYSNNQDSALGIDDDLYSGFDSVPAALDSRTLADDSAFQEAVRTTAVGRRGPTAGTVRMVTGLRTGGQRLGSAAPRPVTAMKAAGFSSSFSSTTSAGRPAAQPLQRPTADTAEEKIKLMEAKIMTLVEESCGLRVPPDPDDTFLRTPLVYDTAKSLSKAQEASALERQILKFQEQNGLSDSHNMDVTFTVLFNLSCAFASAGLVSEALQAHALWARGAAAGASGGGGNGPSATGASSSGAAKRGLGAAAAYLARGDHRRALKLYRMALDGTPANEKDLKLKIMHNIGLLLVRMGKFRDAVTTFQHMMHEGPDCKTGLHLVLCQVSLGDLEGAKASFQALADVDIDSDDDLETESNNEGEVELNSIEASERVLTDVLRADRLSKWLNRKRAEAEKCVLKAAGAISRHDPQGMEWCAEVLRSSARAQLACALEAAGALASLRAHRAARAKTALKRLAAQSRPNIMKRRANANLAFIAFVEGDTAACNSFCSLAGGEALLAHALSVARDSNDWRAARALLGRAAQNDPAARDPAYYLGVACERVGRRDEALVNYERASRIAPGDAYSRARLAAIAHAQGDTDAAAHWYHQVLADSPSDPGLLTHLARLHEEAGDTQAAHQCYLDVDAVFPACPEALGWLGAYAKSSGDAPSALSYFRRAAKLCPGQVEWGLQEGACLRSAGRYQEALGAYKALYERFPDNVECLQALVKLSGDQGLREAGRWQAELDRARRQSQNAYHSGSPLTAGSASSRGSSSPPRTAPTPAGKGVSTSANRLNQVPASSASSRTSGMNRKTSEEEQDLPLPPE